MPRPTYLRFNLFEKATQRISTESFFVLIVTIGSLCGLVQGFIITQSEIYNGNFGHISDDESFVDRYIQLFYFGEMLGALLAFAFSDNFGRKTCLVISSLFCMCMIMWSMVTTHDANLLTARFFIGWGLGVMMATAPLYTAEISTNENRGRAIGLLYFNMVCGSVLSLLVCNIFEALDIKDGWKYTLVFPLLILGFKAIMMLDMPESPRWLLASRTPAECLSAMKQLRRTNDVSREFSAIYCALTFDARLGDGWSDMFIYSPSVRNRLFISLFIQLVQQLVGIQIITVFGINIFNDMGVRNPLLSLVVSVVTRLLGSLFFLAKVDTVGRRTLSMMGCLVMFVSWIGASACAHFGTDPLHDDTILVFVSFPLRIFFGLFLCLFAFSYSFSLGPISWVVTSEIFPYRARGKASALTVAAHFASSMLGTWVLAVWLKSGYGTVACLLAFGGLLLLTCLVIYCFIPETTGIMLEDMDALFEPREQTSCCCWPLAGLNTVPDSERIINKMISGRGGGSSGGSGGVGGGGGSGGGNEKYDSGGSYGYVQMVGFSVGPGTGSVKMGGSAEHSFSNGDASNPIHYGSMNGSGPGMIFIEPDTLHKYSNDMRENKFNYFEDGEEDEVTPSFDISAQSLYPGHQSKVPRPISTISSSSRPFSTSTNRTYSEKG